MEREVAWPWDIRISLLDGTIPDRDPNDFRGDELEKENTKTERNRKIRETRGGGERQTKIKLTG